MKTHGILEQHHALGLDASYAGSLAPRTEVGAAIPMPSCRIDRARARKAVVTFGTCNHPRRLVGFVT